jgi:hypothetical protein
MTRIPGTLYEDQYTFLITSRSVLLIVKNISDKSSRENQNIRFVFNNPPPPENRAVYELMWKNIVEADRPLMTIWRVRISCWVLKATNPLPEYVIPIVFPLQQWSQERV